MNNPSPGFPMGPGLFFINLCPAEVVSIPPLSGRCRLWMRDPKVKNWVWLDQARFVQEPTDRLHQRWAMRRTRSAPPLAVLAVRAPPRQCDIEINAAAVHSFDAQFPK